MIRRETFMEKIIQDRVMFSANLFVQCWCATEHAGGHDKPKRRSLTTAEISVTERILAAGAFQGDSRWLL